MSWTSLAKTVLPLGLLVLTSLTAEASVWRSENQWSEAYEARFSEYIRTVDVNIFKNRGQTWSGIPTDCADAAYALRIIFAYENRLPVSFNTWDGVFTNKMADYDDISDPIKRVRKFIARVNYSTNTRSLVDDSYPIAIRRGILRPGVMFLHPQGSSEVPLTYRAGHVYYLRAVQDDGNIRYMSSTVPTEVRTLNVRNGIQFAPMDEDGGYRAWKWPNTNERPYLSYEQFQLGGWVPHSYRDGKVWTRWQKAIVAQIQTRRPTTVDQLNAQIENLSSVITNRIAVVKKGWSYYQNNYASGQCMTESDYDDHSTPTRDVKIQVELQNFESAARRHIERHGGSLRDLYSQIRFEVLPGVVIDIHQIKKAFLTRTALIISEPEHHPLVRWGLEPQGRWPCPHRASAYVGGESIQ